MALWQFLDYYPEEGGCPISDWYDQRDVPVQAKFDAVVRELETVEEWNDEDLPSFKVFTDKPEHLGLAEIRFYVIEKQKKTHYRAVGVWREEQHQFVFLTGFEKSGRATIPPNAMTEAMRLRIALEEEKGETRGHWPDDLEETIQ